MTTQLEQAARQALEALENAEDQLSKPYSTQSQYAITALRTALEQPSRESLTPREVELIDGMIEVQLHHAQQCDRIANRAMADKQKGWDMERVALLCKLKAAHGIGEKK